jgi:hypothetical protein
LLSIRHKYIINLILKASHKRFKITLSR